MLEKWMAVKTRFISFAIHHRETRAEFASENNTIVAVINELKLTK